MHADKRRDFKQEHEMSIKSEFMQGVKEGRRKSLTLTKTQRAIYFVIVTSFLIVLSFLIAWAIYFVVV